MNNINAIILTDLKTDNLKTPIVLNKIFAKPIVNYILELTKEIGIKNTLCITNIENKNLPFENQTTFNNKNIILDFIYKCETILIFNENLPMFSKSTLETFLNFHNENNFEVSQITNSNTYLVNKKIFEDFISNNETNTLEKYLNNKSTTFDLENENEILTIKNKIDISNATKFLKTEINNFHMLNGVTIVDPDNTYISKDVKIGMETIIYPNVIIEGEVIIGENCFIGSGTKIVDSKISNNVIIENSVILNSEIGTGTKVGPFAYIRPNSFIKENCKVGNFVEIKNSTINENTKASHLTYIGDSEVGSNINFGCGTITVNYDGKNKHKTIIKDNCFIGCNSNLVAPVTIEEGAYIAAGSTITNDVPENSLAIARKRQINKTNWKTKV